MTESWFEEWLEKAEEDYTVASSLHADRTPGAICFHCQQCVEKWLKAALVKHGVATLEPKTSSCSMIWSRNTTLVLTGSRMSLAF